MANPKKGEVPIVIDGNTYILCYDMNSIAELEEFFGEPVQVFLKNLSKGMGVRVLREFLFQGLQLHHATQFPVNKSIGAVMTMTEMKEYGKPVGRALSLAVTGKEPETVQEEVNSDPLPEKKAEDSGTGTDS